MSYDNWLRCKTVDKGGGITGLAITGADGGKHLPSGTKVRFKQGYEDGGYEAVINGEIPRRYNKEDVTYRMSLLFPDGRKMDTTRTARALMSGAEYA